MGSILYFFENACGVWDMGENARVTVGCNLFYGGRGTEFGGFGIPAPQNEAVDELFLWVSYYF